MNIISYNLLRNACDDDNINEVQKLLSSGIHPDPEHYKKLSNERRY